MKRLLLLLLLVSATTVAHGAGDDWARYAQTQFDEWFETNYPAQRLSPCCEDIRRALFVDKQQDHFEDAQQDYAYDLLSHEYRDRAGLKRDTYYFLGYQVVSIGILYILPENMSGWSDEQKEEYSLSRWWYNVRHPTWDSDDFFINYITHPYWGAAYFVRARERGYTNRESFWYSAMLSAMYEFGAEALFEQPSIQDLIVTPVLGSLLGRYFMSVRENTEIGAIERGYETTKDEWILGLTDPLGFMNSYVDKWLGLDVDLQLRPYTKVTRRTRDAPFGPPVRENDTEYGLAFSLRW
jgi:hypothetical protein